MKILLSALMLLSFANAQVTNSEYLNTKASFGITSFGDFGTRIYYNCDSVEAEVEALMKKFGAKNVEVSCTGGINPWGGMATDAFVRLSMDVLTEYVGGTTAAEYQLVEVRETRNCHMLKEVTKATKDLFRVQDLDYTRTCRGGSFDRFRLSGYFLK